MTLSMATVRKIYEDWDMETDPSDDLQDWIYKSRSIPKDEELIDFAKYVIDNYSPEKGGYWIDWAIKYLWRSENDDYSIKYLEKIVSNYEIYKEITAIRSSAASYLGDIASYPNHVLKDAIMFEDLLDTSEWVQEAASQFRAAAFGGYIMTATDFQTGMNAGRAIKSTGEKPTVQKAEAVIAEWRKQQNKDT